MPTSAQNSSNEFFFICLSLFYLFKVLGQANLSVSDGGEIGEKGRERPTIGLQGFPL